MSRLNPSRRVQLVLSVLGGMLPLAACGDFQDVLNESPHHPGSPGDSGGAHTGGNGSGSAGAGGGPAGSGGSGAADGSGGATGGMGGAAGNGSGGDTGSCTDAQKLCDGNCVDSLIDEQNCGACGAVCAATQVCFSGKCSGWGPAVALDAVDGTEARDATLSRTGTYDSVLAWTNDRGSVVDVQARTYDGTAKTWSDVVTLEKDLLPTSSAPVAVWGSGRFPAVAVRADTGQGASSMRVHQFDTNGDGWSRTLDYSDPAAVGAPSFSKGMIDSALLVWNAVEDGVGRGRFVVNGTTGNWGAVGTWATTGIDGVLGVTNVKGTASVVYRKAGPTPELVSSAFSQGIWSEGERRMSGATVEAPLAFVDDQVGRTCLLMGAPATSGHRGLKAATFDGTLWQEPFEISAALEGDTSDAVLGVGIDAPGAAVWVEQTGKGPRLLSRVVDRTTRKWGDVLVVDKPPDGFVPARPSVGQTLTDVIFVAWVRKDASAHEDVWGAYYDASVHGWSSPRLLEDGDGTVTSGPVVATWLYSAASVVWTQKDAGRSRVFLREFGDLN